MSISKYQMANKSNHVIRSLDQLLQPLNDYHLSMSAGKLTCFLPLYSHKSFNFMSRTDTGETRRIDIKNR